MFRFDEPSGVECYLGNKVVASLAINTHANGDRTYANILRYCFNALSKELAFF